MFINALLIILALIVIAGIIRSIITPTTGFWNTLLEILWLDMLIDILGNIFEDLDFD